MSGTARAPMQRTAPGGRPGGPMRGGPMRGGPMGGLGMPVEKAANFGQTLRRLLARLQPERFTVGLVVALALASVACAVAGPKLLGNATDILFEGVIGKRLPAGVSKEQVVAALRARGDTTQADLVSAMDVVPGHGVDFARLDHALLIVVVVYVFASVFAWAQAYLMAGVTQRVIYRLREDVDLKLGRLPLRYVDAHARGDLLSRVTNDIDNVNTTLQQSLTQAITSLSTVIGVLAMMVWISPLLAAISLVTVPLSVIGTVLIAKRAQPYFAQQWRWTGRLNGHVEEMYSGHDIVKVYGRQAQAEAVFDDANERLYRASFRAQFISGIVMPAMNVVGNLGYVGIAIVGGLRVASGQISLGDVQAFIQYSRQFTMPISQLAGLANLIQSGVASAERVFGVLDEAEEEPDPAEPVRLERVRGEVAFEHVAFRYEPDKPLIEDLSLDAPPGRTIAIVGHTGAGKTTLVNLLMRFYEIQAGRITLDGVDIAKMNRGALRRMFGMVLQDTWLFHGTLRENIAYGREGATEEE